MSVPSYKRKRNDAVSCAGSAMFRRSSFPTPLQHPLPCPARRRARRAQRASAAAPSTPRRRTAAETRGARPPACCEACAGAAKSLPRKRRSLPVCTALGARALDGGRATIVRYTLPRRTSSVCVPFVQRASVPPPHRRQRGLQREPSKRRTNRDGYRCDDVSSKSRTTNMCHSRHPLLAGARSHDGCTTCAANCCAAARPPGSCGRLCLHAAMQCRSLHAGAGACDAA